MTYLKAFVLVFFLRSRPSMSAGPGPQAEPTQRTQSAKGPDASRHSALFYLFQEVSKLASPVHGAAVGGASPGRWLKDASPQGSLEAEEEETCCLGSSDHSGPPQEAPPPWTSVKEERPARPGPAGHSPWKVLSLINLQCQRLLHHSDAEESNSRSSSSPPAMDPPSQAAAPCVPTDGATTGTGLGSDPQLRVKEPNVGSLQEDGSSRNGASERDPEHLPRPNIPHATKAPSGGFLNTPPTHGPNTGAVLLLRKPELTLDHNANLSLAIRDPYSQSAHRGTSTQGGGSHGGATATKPPRKQPHPSRSVDIHDPDLQGVMFRMDPELDHRRDQCRLLITSEFRYSSLTYSCPPPQPPTPP